MSAPNRSAPGQCRGTRPSSRLRTELSTQNVEHVLAPTAGVKAIGLVLPVGERFIALRDAGGRRVVIEPA